MTQDYVMHAMLVYELADAKEALESALSLFEPGMDVDEDEYERHIAHLYSHINTAWNVRGLTFEKFDSADDETTDAWTEFPNDIVPI